MKCNEVLIVGGGPAGVATALQLVARGMQVTILEAGLQPKMKPGETLPPQAGKIFQQFNLVHLLGDFACYGNKVVWGNGEVVERLFYKYTSQEGWHINRQRFEAQLQEEARARGVRFQYGCQVQAVEAVAKGWKVTCADQTIIECAFIVDATGRKSRIAKHIGIERRTLDRLVGLYSVVPYIGTIAQYTYIEAVENGWWYMAPLRAQQMVVTYMTDADLVLPEQRTANGFSFLFSNTAFLKTLVATALPAPAIHYAATGYLRQRHGDNWLAVGDAAFAYDPVSSHGIISAMESGYYAGHAIADHLNGHPDALNAYDYAISQAFSVYMDMHADHYAMEGRWRDRAFWARRG